MIQAYDRSLWLGLVVAGAGELWRHDGQTWTEAVTNLPVVYSLAQDGQDRPSARPTGCSACRSTPRMAISRHR